MSLLSVALLASRASLAVAADCAFPIVMRAAVRDIHESWLNGPVGYGFVEGLGGEKMGIIPSQVGRDPVRRFDSDVYASNFQGPVSVRHPDLRPQWEWTADGEPEVSDRSYPLVVARACAPSASDLPHQIVKVAEHDEWPLSNDGIGAFAIDLRACSSVLSPTRPFGWSGLQHSEGTGYDQNDPTADVVFVDYSIWCYRCEGTADCERDIVWSAAPQR